MSPADRVWRGLVWERQPKESDAAWAAFCTYRDLPGKRTYTAVAKAVGKHLSLIAAWGQKWAWDWRLDQMAAVETQERERAIREEARRQAEAQARERVSLVDTIDHIVRVSLERTKAALEADPALRLRPYDLTLLNEVAAKVRAGLPVGMSDISKAMQEIDEKIIRDLEERRAKLLLAWGSRPDKAEQ